MRLSEILSADRVLVVAAPDTVTTKKDAIERLARLLADGTSHLPDTIFKVLMDREQLQSTGIGDGVAIPHGSLAELSQQIAAVLLSPHGIDFDSIDSRPAHIVIGVVGPRHATGEHLRMLARISRLLRDGAFRDRLLAATDGATAYSVISAEEDTRT